MLYHLTARANLDRILSDGEIASAAELMHRAGDVAPFRSRRRDAYALERAGTQLGLLRDQAPLHPGNIELHGGWSFEDFVESLNRRVFFWPGDTSRPIDYGLRHFARYEQEDVVVIRVSTATLLEMNPVPKLCRYNSGSPRCVGGRRSPRGPATFVHPADADFTPGRVVEVTFEGRAVLPSEGLNGMPGADRRNRLTASRPPFNSKQSMLPQPSGKRRLASS